MARELLGLPFVLVLESGRTGLDALLELNLQHADLLVLGDGLTPADLGVPPERTVRRDDPAATVEAIRHVVRTATPRLALGARGAFAAESGRARDPRIPVQPFVVLSAPRSGTNLLVGLLDQHPDVLARGELF